MLIRVALLLFALASDETTPLHWAVHNNDVAAVDRLI